MKPWVLGLTGGIGSGKSAAARHFETLGIQQVDADIVARYVVEPGQPALTAIVQQFGEKMLQANGQLDRAALRAHIFKDKPARQWLEALLHPLIRQEIYHRIDAAQAPYVILTAPLLIESEALRNKVNRILVIDTTEALQIHRTTQRDNVLEDQVRAILSSQTHRHTRLSYANDVIENNSDLSWLHREVERLHNYYLTLSFAGLSV